MTQSPGLDLRSVCFLGGGGVSKQLTYRFQLLTARQAPSQSGDGVPPFPQQLGILFSAPTASQEQMWPVPTMPMHGIA